MRVRLARHTGCPPEAWLGLGLGLGFGLGFGLGLGLGLRLGLGLGLRLGLGLERAARRAIGRKGSSGRRVKRTGRPRAVQDRGSRGSRGRPPVGVVICVSSE